jgi:hypothetical protein
MIIATQEKRRKTTVEKSAAPMYHLTEFASNSSVLEDQ